MTNDYFFHLVNSLFMYKEKLFLNVNSLMYHTAYTLTLHLSTYNRIVVTMPLILCFTHDLLSISCS